MCFTYIYKSHPRPKQNKNEPTTAFVSIQDEKMNSDGDNSHETLLQLLTEKLQKIAKLEIENDRLQSENDHLRSIYKIKSPSFFSSGPVSSLTSERRAGSRRTQDPGIQEPGGIQEGTQECYEKLNEYRREKNLEKALEGRMRGLDAEARNIFLARVKSKREQKEQEEQILFSELRNMIAAAERKNKAKGAAKADFPTPQKEEQPPKDVINDTKTTINDNKETKTPIKEAMMPQMDGPWGEKHVEDFLVEAKARRMRELCDEIDAIHF
jgi:hypothetical protein